MTLAATLACSNSSEQRLDRFRDDTEWPRASNDAGGTRYSPLSTIDRGNVDQLRAAWMVRTGDFPPEVFDPVGHRAGSQRADGTHVIERPGAGCAYCHSTQLRFETTPILQGGRLYISTPKSRILALHPANGSVVWEFDPQLPFSRTRFTEDLTSRGVSVWVDGQAAGERCAVRLFIATATARLWAIDADDGSACAEFGSGGVVRLDSAISVGSRVAVPGHYSVTSPPTVIDDLVIVGSAVSKTHRRDAASGAIRAYDARSGALVWTFDPIPRSAAHPAWDKWDPEAARSTGGANAWAQFAADLTRGLLFVPTATAAPDHYGGERLGRNDFANSIVALRASTGEVAWSFQVVHHDLWDYDVATPPMLVTLEHGKQDVPAVVVGTKTGFIFVLNRETGTPIFPVEERPVPLSSVPGETAWPTQPFPVNIPGLSGTSLTADSAFGLSERDLQFCRTLIQRLRNEGVFTPPSLEGTLVWPGLWGGLNWSGMAWDQDRQLVITTAMRLGTVVQLHRRDETPMRQPDAFDLNWEAMAQEGTPYSASRAPLIAPSGVPCTPPPWGTLAAISLRDGSVEWQRPLGEVPGLVQFDAAREWGSIVFGGPLVTGGRLVFIAASQDDSFRAFDVDSGDLLWEYKLPAGGQAAPMTYMHEGRQYIVIAAGGRAGIGSPGDWVIGFALP